MASRARVNGGARREVEPAGAALLPRVAALEGRLAALRREHGELQQAVSDAAQVHRKFCAPRQLHRRSFEIAGEVFAVRHLSGDFFNLLDLGGAAALAVGDIAGKGLTAGLWLTHLIGLIRLHAASLADPAATAAAINRDLCRLLAEPPMTALFLARLDLHGGGLAYCNAGLPPALLVRGDGTAEWLEEGGPMLGAVEQVSFRSGCVNLAPGDTLVAYSDGIVEGRNARGEEFGPQRLLEAARAACSLPASQLLFSLLGAARDFTANHPREDDLTVMVVKRSAAAIN